jgi:hypothetical protein
MAMWRVGDIAAILYVLTIFCFALSVHGHGSQHHAPAHVHIPKRAAVANVTLAEAKDVVARFQEAMTQANAAILANPRKNNYTIYTETEVKDAVKPAPLLEYDNSNSTVAQKLRRSYWRRQLSNETTPGNSSALSYTIPPEVIEAARIVAEANPPVLSSAEYDSIVASMKERNAPRNNDTNAMPQILQNPSGLLEYVGNVTGANPAVVAPTTKHKKRAASDFWMQNIIQRGSSPYAPAGYKVRFGHLSLSAHLTHM